MHRYNDFGILVECKECLIDLQQKLDYGEHLVLNEIPRVDNRKIALEFIISTLFSINQGRFSPKSTPRYDEQIVSILLL